MKKEKEAPNDEPRAKVLCQFLKFLFEVLQEPTACKMQELINEFDPKLFCKTLLPTVLVKNGILRRQTIGRGNTREVLYQWMSTTEPNLKMGFAVIDACRTHQLDYYAEKLKDKACETIKEASAMYMPVEDEEGTIIRSMYQVEIEVIDTSAWTKDAKITIKLSNLIDSLNMYSGMEMSKIQQLLNHWGVDISKHEATALLQLCYPEP